MANESLPGLLMGVLAAVCLLIAAAGLHRALRRTAWPQNIRQRIFLTTVVVTLAWLAVLGMLARRGFFLRFDSMPPRPLLAILLPLLVLTIIAFSKGFKRLLRATPLHWLIFFQAFRIPVELLLWQGYQRGLVPVQMTFEGRNFDVLTGVLALVAGWIVMKRKEKGKPVAVIFNVAGLLLLLNILIVAILSMPTPFRYFTNEPANTVVATFPFIYLPGVLVVLAAGFHLFSLRQWALTGKQETA